LDIIRQIRFYNKIKTTRFLSSIIIASTITFFIAISIFYSIDHYSDEFFITSVTTASANPIPDDNGVIMYNYPDVEGNVYNPLILASWGLEYYNKYENTRDTKFKNYFINTANWLVDNAKDKEEGKYSIWEYDFTWPWYDGVTPPYYSGYAQAIGITVLALAYNMTSNQTYLEEVNKAFQAFLVDYDQGGVTTIEEDNNGDSIFIHELVKPGFQKTYILNGHTGSLLHIWQYYELTKDPQAKSIFEKGINYLKHNLEKFDTGSWSLYDQTLINENENIASNIYHSIHIDHLNALYDITSEQILKEYADIFVTYI
jgi:heparosan-N-sulfate-glucuronate 5-epimerase